MSIPDADALYEDFDSKDPEKDEAKAVTARNALASLDAAASLALLLDSPVVDVAVPASGALFNMALSLAGAERIRQQGLTATLLGGSGLRHADGRVRANAAGVLQNVAAHLDEARAQLAAEGALAALLDLVASESALGTADGVHVIARALGALSNCALLEANVRALCGLLAPGVQGGGEAGAKGGLGALLHILGAVQREDVLEDASSLLVRILTVSEPARAELVSLDGLSAVQRLMGSADEELQIRGCQLLRLCAASEPRAHAYALASALAPALVELFAAASEEVQEAAVRAATALCERPAFGAALRKADGISALVELLASRDEELIAACLFCLGQLARIDGPSRARIRDDGGVEATARLLSHGSARVAAAAAHVVRFVALNEETKRAVREAGALPTLCALLAGGEREPALTTSALGALVNLILNEPESAALVRRAGGFERSLPLLSAAAPTLALLSARLFERGLLGSADNRTHCRAIGALRPLVANLGCADEQRRLASVGALAHAAHLDAPNQVHLRELGAAAGLVALLGAEGRVGGGGEAEAEGAADAAETGADGDGGGCDEAEGAGEAQRYASARELAVELRRRACWALSHIACEPLGAAAVRCAGGHAALLALLWHPKEGSAAGPEAEAPAAAGPEAEAPAAELSVGLVSAGISCIYNCVMNDGPASARGLVEAGALGLGLEALQAATVRGDYETAAFATGVLTSLTLSERAATEQLHAAEGGLALLLASAAPALPPALVCNAASTLCNAAATSPAVALRLIELGAVGAACALLEGAEAEQPPSVLDRAAALLANLAALPEGRAAGAAAEAPRAASELLQPGPAAVRTIAAHALANLAARHPPNCQAGADAGAPEPLLGALLAGPPSVVQGITVHSDVQLASAVALRNLTVSAQCVEAVLEALVDAPAPAGQAPVAPAPPKVSGLGALAAALTLGQPHESIKAKASVAAALANCAALPEGRLALLSHGLLPVALGVLADATQPLTRAKALTQAGTDQPAVADRAEMSGLLVELCAQLCMLLRNAALSPACKGVLLEEEACLPLLAAILRSADSPALLAHAAGALQNLQDRSEARPGVPANPISAGERSMLKVHQLKQRLHAAGQGAAEPLPPSLRALDDDAEDGGPSSRTKRDFRLLPAQKLSATHDVKEMNGPFTSEPVTTTFMRETTGCSRRQPLERYEPVLSPLPSARASPLPSPRKAE